MVITQESGLNPKPLWPPTFAPSRQVRRGGSHTAGPSPTPFRMCKPKGGIRRILLLV